jgi:hypothetical protein
MIERLRQHRCRRSGARSASDSDLHPRDRSRLKYGSSDRSRRQLMPQTRCRPDEIIAKLRKADVCSCEEPQPPREGRRKPMPPEVVQRHGACMRRSAILGPKAASSGWTDSRGSRQLQVSAGWTYRRSTKGEKGTARDAETMTNRGSMGACLTGAAPTQSGWGMASTRWREIAGHRSSGGAG